MTTIIIKGDQTTYLNAADIRAAGGEWNKERKIWRISAENLWDNMMYDGRRTIDGFYHFDIENRADWDAFVDAKKSAKEQAEQTEIQEKANNKAAALVEQTAIINEKIASHGFEQVKTDLIDALSGNKTAAEAVINGTRLMTTEQLKDFLTYAQ